jgi:predicted oxidoreductase
VEFTDAPKDTPAFDLAKFVKDGWIVSSTGQLRWKEGNSRTSGFFTLNTAATKAVVGFAEGQACELGNVTIRPRSRFGAVYVTAKERDRDIDSSKGLLVVAVARARNAGMKVLNDERILEAGKGPVVMEPVKAEISIRRKGNPSVIVLDHNGRRTDRTLPAKDGTFEIDGARDKACYYLVSYPE